MQYNKLRARRPYRATTTPKLVVGSFIVSTWVCSLVPPPPPHLFFWREILRVKARKRAAPLQIDQAFLTFVTDIKLINRQSNIIFISRSKKYNASTQSHLAVNNY